MATFGKRSKAVLEGVHADLQAIHWEVIRYYDHSVYERYRDLERQWKLFQEGKSKIDGIRKRGKHNYFPSLATDSAPYPIDFADRLKAKARFYQFSGYMFAVAKRLLEEGKISHRLRWGGDWDSDKDFEDQSFDDLPHFELIK